MFSFVLFGGEHEYAITFIATFTIFWYAQET